MILVCFVGTSLQMPVGFHHSATLPVKSSIEFLHCLYWGFLQSRIYLWCQRAVTRWYSVSVPHCSFFFSICSDYVYLTLHWKKEYPGEHTSSFNHWHFCYFSLTLISDTEDTNIAHGAAIKTLMGNIPQWISSMVFLSYIIKVNSSDGPKTCNTYF